MHCIPGEHSWCSWQRAIAKSAVSDSHGDHETLPPEIEKKFYLFFFACQMKQRPANSHNPFLTSYPAANPR